MPTIGSSTVLLSNSAASKACKRLGSCRVNDRRQAGTVSTRFHYRDLRLSLLRRIRRPSSGEQKKAKDRPMAASRIHLGAMREGDVAEEVHSQPCHCKDDQQRGTAPRKQGWRTPAHGVRLNAYMLISGLAGG